jgi:hypothetical protein
MPGKIKPEPLRNVAALKQAGRPKLHRERSRN